MKPYQIIEAINLKNINREELIKINDPVVNLFLLENYKYTNLELIDLIKPLKRKLKEYYLENINFNEEEVDYLLKNNIFLSKIKISIELQDKYYEKLKLASFDDSKFNLDSNITIEKFKNLKNKENVLSNNIKLFENNDLAIFILEEIIKKDINDIKSKDLNLILKNIDFNIFDIKKLDVFKGKNILNYNLLEKNISFKNKINKLDFFKEYNDNINIFNLDEIKKHKEIITQEIIDKKININNIDFLSNHDDLFFEKDIEKTLMDIVFFEKLIKNNVFEKTKTIKANKLSLLIEAMIRLKKDEDENLLNIIFNSINKYSVKEISKNMNFLFKSGIKNKNFSQYKGIFKDWIVEIKKENKKNLLIELLEDNIKIINTRNGKAILNLFNKKFKDIHNKYYIDETIEIEDYDAFNIEKINFLYGKDLYGEINKNKNNSEFLDIALNNIKIFEYLSKDLKFLRKNTDNILNKLENLPMPVIEAITKLNLVEFVKNKQELINKLTKMIFYIKNIKDKEYEDFESRLEISFLMFFKINNINEDEEKTRKIKEIITFLLELTKEYNDEVILKLIEEKDFKTLNLVKSSITEKIEKKIKYINFKEVIKNKETLNLIQNIKSIKLTVDEEDYDKFMLMKKSEIEQIIDQIDSNEIIKKIIIDNPQIFVDEKTKSKIMFSFFSDDKYVNKKEILDKEDILILYKNLIDKKINFSEMNLVSIIKDKNKEEVLSFFKEKSKEIYSLLIFEYYKDKDKVSIHDLNEDNCYDIKKNKKLSFDVVDFKIGLEKIIKYKKENKINNYISSEHIRKICNLIDDNLIETTYMEDLIEKKDLVGSEKYRKNLLQNLNEENLNIILETKLMFEKDELITNLIDKLIDKKDPKLINYLLKTIDYYKKKIAITKESEDDYKNLIVLSIGSNNKLIEEIINNKKFKNLEDTLELYRDTNKKEIISQKKNKI